MSEPSFLNLFRSHWQEIARQFWPETAREQVESELARLDAELQRRQNRLLLFRKKTERLKHRLTLLAALVQKTPTDSDALAELERQQRSMDRLRERLQERERGYARRLARLRQRKQMRAELRERLLSGSLPRPMDDEDDPDYPF